MLFIYASFAEGSDIPTLIPLHFERTNASRYGEVPPHVEVEYRAAHSRSSELARLIWAGSGRFLMGFRLGYAAAASGVVCVPRQRLWDI